MDLKPDHITVVNKYKGSGGGTGVYIGRPSPLGNPFSHLDNASSHVTKVATREEAVARYAGWLDEKLASRDPEVCREMNKLLWMAREGPLKLLCYCAPKACHGDIIRDRLFQHLSKL